MIWNLIISIAKTKIVIYNQIYAKHFFSFTLGENALEIVDKYKYLGLWCSNNKNIFVKNHSYLAEQARKAIFTIRNYSHSLGHLTPKLSLRVFEAQIEPILMYGGEVLFIGKEIANFEMVHYSFLKNMLGVKQQTTSVTIYGDTGRYPLFLKQQILALKYWWLCAGPRCKYWYKLPRRKFINIKLPPDYCVGHCYRPWSDTGVPFVWSTSVNILTIAVQN